MSITNYPDADFTPDIPNSGANTGKQSYNPTGSFRFWAQKVLPTVYDDSLSYYEILTKVVNYLNAVIQNVDSLNDSVDNTNSAFDTLQEYVNDTKDTIVSAYNELQSYVNTYFDSLDVQEEINAKLDDMASDGSLSNVVSPFIPSVVTDWLSNNITPTSPAIDASLSISGAGADAKVTGESIRANSTMLETANSRLESIDGLIFPEMELGTIGMSSSSLAFNNSTNTVRIGENNGIYVHPNDIIHITDYNIVKFRYALLQDDTGTYVYTTSWLTSDYRISKNGRLWIIATYNDGREITNPTDIAKYVSVVTTGGDINTLNERIATVESYNAILANKQLPYDLFGAGTYGSGNYNPTFRPWRLSTVRTLTYDFDLYVSASSGWRFMCNKYVDGAWTGVNIWVTSIEIQANTPFGLILARNAEDEDTTSTATAEDFLPNFTFNVDVSETIDTIGDRITALENDFYTTVDTEKIKTYMSRFYGSNVAEAYAFFTDPHLMGSAGEFDESAFNRYINVLAETVKQTSAGYVVCGGDWLNREDNKAQAAKKLGFVDGKMRSIFPNRYYPIVGNHDFNYIGYEDGSRLPESEWISNNAMRNFWFHDHEQCYYKFKAMTAQNYVLNTRTDYDGTNTYDKAMLDWLSAQLIEDDAPHCTIMFHIMHLTSVSSAIPKRVAAIGKIIEAFNNHTVCTLSNDTEGYDKTYDFTETTGKIDYVIVGHTHADFTETFGGVPVIGCVNFTKDNTPSFDLVFADYTNNKVYTTRIGSGESREFNI